MLPEQIGVIFGIVVRQIQVARVDYIKNTKREICLDVLQRVVFVAFLFLFFVRLDIRSFLGIVGMEIDIGTGFGGFLTGFGGDAFLSWITSHFYPKWKNKLEKLRRKKKENKEE